MVMFGIKVRFREQIQEGFFHAVHVADDYQAVGRSVFAGLWEQFGGEGDELDHIFEMGSGLCAIFFGLGFGLKSPFDSVHDMCSSIS